MSSNFSIELVLGQPGERAVDADVVACRQLGIEADAELDEGREQAIHRHASRIGDVDSGQDPEQRALPAAVRPDDPEELSLLDLEADASERLVAFVGHAPERMQEVLLEERPLLVRDAERLVDVGDLDRWRH